MNNDHYVLEMTGLDDGGDAAVLAFPRQVGSIESFQLADGDAVAHRFASGVTIPFDPEFPKGRRLLDLQPNTSGLLPVSAKLRQLLAVEPAVEFLPLKLADHRQKIVSEEYVLANFIDPVDCIDLNASKYTASSIDPSRIKYFKKLVLDEQRVPKDRHIFRLKERRKTLIVTAPLAESIRQANVTGVGFVPIDKYPLPGSLL